MPAYIQPKIRTTRTHQSHQLRRLGSTSDVYSHSFFSRTLRDWNELPQNIAELPTLEQFKGAIRANYFSSALLFTRTLCTIVYSAQFSDRPQKMHITAHNLQQVAEQALLRKPIEVEEVRKKKRKVQSEIKEENG